MIGLRNISINLKLNGASGAISDTGAIFTQNDNMVGKFEFNVVDYNGDEIDYSELTKAIMLMKVGSSFFEPIQCDINAEDITVIIGNELISTVGTYECCIKVYSDNHQVHTSNVFTYTVKAGLYGTEESNVTPQQSLINALIMKVDGKSKISLYDSTKYYESQEPVIKEGIIYTANSDIAPNTPFVEGVSDNEWTAVSNVGTGVSLGITETTAYRGDRGKISYDHSQSDHAPSGAQVNSDITKEEIEAKLTGSITSHSHGDVNSILRKTQAEFDALSPVETTMYIIID